MANEIDRPAYMIVSGKVIHPERVGPYGEAAGPLAQAAGIEVLGRGEPIVLEGSLPQEGFFVVEKFPSMKALESFWYSAEYQAAVKLREGVVDIDFIVAVESADA